MAIFSEVTFAAASCSSPARQMQCPVGLIHFGVSAAQLAVQGVNMLQDLLSPLLHLDPRP
ncbi:hypothetical protein P606_18665 [Comamonas thiooxydans]|nr:hypothetical protein P606_18665 [Comamonas thiooxydans]